MAAVGQCKSRGCGYGRGLLTQTPPPRVSNSISLNASIFSAVCLASRLSSSFHVFVIVCVAVLTFALFPQFRTTCKVCVCQCVCVCMCICSNICVIKLFHSQDYHSALFPLTTATMVALTLSLLATISLVAMVFYLLTVLALTFLCPLLFVRLQHLKKLALHSFTYGRCNFHFFGVISLYIFSLFQQYLRSLGRSSHQIMTEPVKFSIRACALVVGVI